MSERTRIKRLPERGSDDRALLDAILDEALICHFGFTRDDGPVVLPTIHARVGDTIYLHGSVAAGNMRALRDGRQVCLTVTLVDGIVAARALFHHSLNYRSAVVFGAARVVDDPGERDIAFRAITEHVLPGRWQEARHPNDSEDRQTMLLAVSMDEWSVKTSTGGPEDDEADYASDIWAGVIPLAVTASEPVPDDRLRSGIDVPSSVAGYQP